MGYTQGIGALDTIVHRLSMGEHVKGQKPSAVQVLSIHFSF